MRRAAVTLLLCTTACFASGDSDPIANDGPCMSNAECDDGELCVQGSCRIPCDTRSQCAANEICSDGLCEVGQAESCGPELPCPTGFICRVDQCEPLQEPGTICESGDECRSGECSDGICCNRQCDGVCESCLEAVSGGENGVCTPTDRGTNPGERCGANAVCDGAGACKTNLGAACADGAGCLSGFCVDGVCCEDACDSVCVACSNAVSGGSNGECTPLLARTEEVTADPVFEDCPGVQTCDGSGACFAKPQGAPCAGNDECAGGRCVDGACCESSCSGTCRECSTGLCLMVTSGADPGTCASCFGDGTCDGKDLLEACTSPSECASNVCAGGQCRLGNGVACAGDNECENTCIDGTCAPVATLFGACDSPPDCGSGLECSGGFCFLANGGSCVENAQCTNVCINTQCANQSPVNGACDEQSDCQGALICPGSSCLPLVGLGAACQDTAQCPSPATCTGGTCRNPIGGVCGGDAECASGNCRVGECFELGLGDACFSQPCLGGLTCENVTFVGTACYQRLETVSINFVLRNISSGTSEAFLNWRGSDDVRQSRELNAVGAGASSSTTASVLKGSFVSFRCVGTSMTNLSTVQALPPAAGELSQNIVTGAVGGPVFRSGTIECAVND
ncbi:MAG: hypothetical protein AAF654_05565 [Myxococcota bacterium]